MYKLEFENLKQKHFSHAEFRLPHSVRPKSSHQHKLLNQSYSRWKRWTLFQRRMQESRQVFFKLTSGKSLKLTTATETEFVNQSKWQSGSLIVTGPWTNSSSQQQLTSHHTFRSWTRTEEERWVDKNWKNLSSSISSTPTETDLFEFAFCIAIWLFKRFEKMDFGSKKLDERKLKIKYTVAMCWICACHISLNLKDHSSFFFPKLEPDFCSARVT